MFSGVTKLKISKMLINGFLSYINVTIDTGGEGRFFSEKKSFVKKKRP